MQQEVNRKYGPLFREHPRYFLLMGGRGGGRSTVASQFAVAKLVSDEYFRCAIMRYVLGDVRNSIYREITDRADEKGILDKFDVNESTMVLRYGANTINAVGFRKSSGDRKAKLKSLANYNCVIIEEADEVPEEDFIQLDDSLRTLKGGITIILLLNPPPKNHWIIRRWFDLRPSGVDGFYVPELRPDAKDAVFIRTDYRDNLANLSPQTVTNYEAYERTNPAHFWNMVRGYVPEVARGLIYRDWAIVDQIPHEARLERYGLDFGYSNDPTAVVAVYRYNGGYILDEIAYQKQLSNKQIADILLNVPRALVIADSAEPKSIDEIKRHGVNILPAEKGKDSVLNGIQRVQAERISVTRRSSNLIVEKDNYAWIIDKDGQSVNEPNHAWSHGMDATRYAIVSLQKRGPVLMKPTTGLVKPYPGMAA